jgi:hypothetical protein
MLIVVISFNIALATLCLGIVWKLRQARRALQRATRWLTHAEQNTDRVLSRAPYYILVGQSGVQYSRTQLTGLSTLQQQITRLVALFQLLKWMRQPQLRFLPERLTARAKPLN